MYLKTYDIHRMLNRFEVAQARIKGTRHYKENSSGSAPYGYFKGRRIIGETGKIDGGVFIGVCQQEAIVIDSKYKLLPELIEKLIVRIEGIAKEKEILAIVQDFAVENLSGTEDDLNQLIFHKSAQDDGKIAIDEYLKVGKGLHRHRTLFASYLIEKLNELGILTGKVSFRIELDRSKGDREGLTYVTERGAILDIL